LPTGVVHTYATACTSGRGREKGWWNFLGQHTGCFISKKRAAFGWTDHAGKNWSRGRPKVWGLGNNEKDEEARLERPREDDELRNNRTVAHKKQKGLTNVRSEEGNA